MNLSDEEEDFLSADEDVSCDNQQSRVKKNVSNINRLSSTQSKSDKNIDRAQSSGEGTSNSSKLEQNKDLQETKVEQVHSQTKNDNLDDDEEEVIAERIRERNLKLAKKFSAELAKNVKTSAPIPVKSKIGFKVDYIDYPNSPDLDIKSSLPPAPPPTPALSSSFNTDDLGASSTTGGTQYGWRVPTVAKPSCTNTSDVNSEQARMALDRLSEKLSQPRKNLLEKVADDIRRVAEDVKKVSISPSVTDSQASSDGLGGPAIPSISDLGNTISGWSWKGASHLMATASQVTSQVGSVFESVVNVQQNLPQPSQQSGELDKDEIGQKSDSSQETKKASMSAIEATSNDAIVDLTLNAMESLGKKAFRVMTERNESGSLQIKGLGRPWEHLPYLRRSEQTDSSDEVAAKDEPEPEPEVFSFPTTSDKKNVDESSGLVNRRRR